MEAKPLHLLCSHCVRGGEDRLWEGYDYHLSRKSGNLVGRFKEPSVGAVAPKCEGNVR